MSKKSQDSKKGKMIGGGDSQKGKGSATSGEKPKRFNADGQKDE